MSKAISELNALCEVLSYMHRQTAFDSAKQIYHHFCNPGTGTTNVWYGTDDYGKVFCVHFMHITWIGAISKLSISTIRPY